MQLREKNNFNLSSLKVGFVLPAYNEHENIFELLKQIDLVFNNKVILIIDDSTNNKTKDKIYLKKDLQYFKRTSKLGRGSAVLSGLKTLLKNEEINFFVEMCTDLADDPKELPDNIKYFLENKLDLLVMSRYLKGSKIINWTIKRKLFSFLANKFAKSLLKVPVSDYTNGYRIYSRKAAAQMVKNCGKISYDFIALSETLVELYIDNLRIGEIKTTFTNREKGESTMNLKLILDSFFGLLKLYINRRKEINSVVRKKSCPTNIVE